VLATQELTASFDWVASSVRDIRMLRIEENTDLAPAIDHAHRTSNVILSRRPGTLDGLLSAIKAGGVPEDF
jgi:hypothetical protein